MKRSLLAISFLVAAAGCQNQVDTSTPKSFQTSYHKVLGPEVDPNTVAVQLFAVLQRYAYTPEGGNLAPHFKRTVDSVRGTESLIIASAEEGIKCDKITSLAGTVYMCEFALHRERLAHDTDERSVPAILYKALANVRGTSPKAIMDGRNSIGCTKDAQAGYGCEFDLLDAANKGDGTEPLTPPQEDPATPPQEDPATPPSDIPVFQ